MTQSPIQVAREYSNQVLRITLHTPPANVLTAATMEAMTGALELARADTDLKLLLITGAGQHFSYGASVAEHLPEQAAAMLRVFHTLIEQVITHPVASLAVVRGQCLGGGFELALAASQLFAESSARLGVPEIKLGVFPPVAAALLPTAQAAKLILTGRSYPAEKLAPAGLVASLSDPEALDEAVREHIEKSVLPLSAAALRFAHRALRMQQIRHFRAVIGDLESLYLDELMASHDAREGIQSFLDKRTPVWSNA